MKIITTVAEATAKIRAWKQEGHSIGFVPTMGYLHQGHASLMKAGKSNHSKVVVSIFVNPTQFAVGEDLDSYPRDLEGDQALCMAEGVDMIFAPTAAEMYPKGFSTSVTMSGLTQELCGKSRPSHFGGVCLVVSKLFHIISPDCAYFGEKDAQQLAIIQQMVTDLNMNVTVVGCPIIREADGLAMSSRNAYLSPEDRSAALILSRSLSKIRELLQKGETDCQILRNTLRDLIQGEPRAMLDYGEIVDARSLEPVDNLTDTVLVALAVRFGSTRLIDNFTFKKEDVLC